MTDTGGFTFSYESYRGLLKQLTAADYGFKKYDDRIEHSDVLLRHDVDWSPSKALRMAEIEAELNIYSTYFFLLTSPFYNALFEDNRESIQRIYDLGHDVGVHFSTHQYWSDAPTDSELEYRVQEEIEILKTVVDDVSDAVSFHIPPDWILREEFQSFDSTYAERFFTDIEYRGDSNQRWRQQHPFTGGIPNTVQILVHPGLWGDMDQSFQERLDSIRTSRFAEIRDFLEYQYIDDEIER